MGESIEENPGNRSKAGVEMTKTHGGLTWLEWVVFVAIFVVAGCLVGTVT